MDKSKKKPQSEDQGMKFAIWEDVASSLQSARLRFPLALTARCHVCLSTDVPRQALLQAEQKYWGDIALT